MDNPYVIDMDGSINEVCWKLRIKGKSSVVGYLVFRRCWDSLKKQKTFRKFEIESCKQRNNEVIDDDLKLALESKGVLLPGTIDLFVNK